MVYRALSSRAGPGILPAFSSCRPRAGRRPRDGRDRKESGALWRIRGFVPIPENRPHSDESAAVPVVCSTVLPVIPEPYRSHNHGPCRQHACERLNSGPITANFHILVRNSGARNCRGVLSILSARLIPDWDADYTQLGLILFCIGTMQLMRRHGFGVWQGAVAGAAFGTLFLLSQVVLLVGVPWIGFLLIVRRSKLREAVRFLILMLVAAILVNAPWLVRNYRIWGELVTRTNFGIVLHSSNSDCAKPSVYEELRDECAVATNPETGVLEAILLKSMGEPAYNRLKTRQAVTWIRSHPHRFLELTFARIVQFWFPVPVAPLYSIYMVWIITVLSIPGLFLMLRRRVPAGFFLSAAFLFYPLVYYIVVSEIRYRVPIIWLSSLTAGYFLADVASHRRARPSSPFDARWIKQ